MDTHAVYLGMCVSRAITNLVCILSTLWCGPVFGQALYSNSRCVRSQFSFAVCCEYYTLYGVKVVCVCEIYVFGRISAWLNDDEKK